MVIIVLRSSNPNNLKGTSGYPRVESHGSYQRSVSVPTLKSDNEDKNMFVCLPTARPSQCMSSERHDEGLFHANGRKRRLLQSVHLSWQQKAAMWSEWGSASSRVMFTDVLHSTVGEDRIQSGTHQHNHAASNCHWRRTQPHRSR